MPGHRIQRVQDAVHGLMEFRGLENTVVDILRTAELQRLRRIRQLGLTFYVFPSAEHSRLVHSLGAAHLAIEFGTRLEEIGLGSLAPPLRVDQEARRDLALAAVCHDLGHGPLSHVWEREVVRQPFDRSAWIASLGLEAAVIRPDAKWHELVGQAFLLWPEGELHQVLESQEEGSSERIQRLLAGSSYLDYLPRLLSSDVDVDRCDFLLRDAMQTGVTHGRYDLRWLISMLALGEADDGRLVVGFDYRKAPRVIEQFVVARRALYDSVYQHKTVRSAEGMIGLLLRRLRELDDLDWLFEDSALLEPYRAVLTGGPVAPGTLLELDDYSFWVLITHIASCTRGDDTAIDLAQRIIRRDFFKQVPIDGKRLKQFLLAEDGRSALDPILARHCKGDPRYYMYVDDKSFEMFAPDEPSATYLVDRDGGRAIGHATLARDHPELTTLFLGRPEESDRLFVPREAIEAVVDLLDLSRKLGP